MTTLNRKLTKSETQEHVDYMIFARQEINKILSDNGQTVRVTVERQIERLESREIDADYDGACAAYRAYRTTCSDFNMPEPQKPEWCRMG